MMKINLIYNYNLKNPIIYINQNKIFIYDDNKKYILNEIFNSEEIYEIYNSIKRNNLEPFFYKIVKTRNNMLTIRLNNKNYVLLELIKTTKNIQKKIEISSNNILDKSNWSNLWTKNSDYLYNKYHTIIKKQPELECILDYYIGMTETAIQYLKINNVIVEPKERYITHKRYNELENPLDIVYDCKERIVAEKIKNNFFNYNKKDIDNILNEVQINNFEFKKIYARLLYPTYFYDILDNIDEKNSNQEIKKIINKVCDYEKFLKELYIKSSCLNKNKKIDWI